MTAWVIRVVVMMMMVILMIIMDIMYGCTSGTYTDGSMYECVKITKRRIDDGGGDDGIGKASTFIHIYSNMCTYTRQEVCIVICSLTCMHTHIDAYLIPI